jgi:hypothetical protein
MDLEQGSTNIDNETQETAEELRKQREWFEVTLASIGDGVDHRRRRWPYNAKSSRRTIAAGRLRSQRTTLEPSFTSQRGYAGKVETPQCGRLRTVDPWLANHTLPHEGWP